MNTLYNSSCTLHLRSHTPDLPMACPFSDRYPVKFLLHNKFMWALIELSLSHTQDSLTCSRPDSASQTLNPLDFHLDPLYRESAKPLCKYLLSVNPQHSASCLLTAHALHGLLVVWISKLQESEIEDKKLHTECNYLYGFVISCHSPSRSEISRNVTGSVAEHRCVWCQ